MPSRFWNACSRHPERRRMPRTVELSRRIPRLRSDDYFGKRNNASAPGAPTRFASVNVPPCASAICRERARPIPEPPGLVVKNGTNKFVGFMIPSPSSRTKISTHSPASFQPMVTAPRVASDASAALCSKLISACSTCPASARIEIAGPPCLCTGNRVSKFAARSRLRQYPSLPFAAAAIAPVAHMPP